MAAPEPARKRRVEKPDRVKSRTVSVNPRYEAFITGELTWEDLDDEEIMRGQLRSRDGTFKGRPPAMIPKQFATALMDRQRKFLQTEMAHLVVTAYKTIDEVMRKQHPQPGDGARIQAANLVLQRYLGKIPDTINIKQEIEVWEKKVEKVIIVDDLDNLGLPTTPLREIEE